MAPTVLVLSLSASVISWGWLLSLLISRLAPIVYTRRLSLHLVLLRERAAAAAAPDGLAPHGHKISRTFLSAFLEQGGNILPSLVSLLSLGPFNDNK
jgi:hypothetical protein